MTVTTSQIKHAAEEIRDEMTHEGVVLIFPLAMDVLASSTELAIRLSVKLNKETKQ